MFFCENKAKTQYWRGFPEQNGLKPAPVLVFRLFLLGKIDSHRCWPIAP